MLGAPVRIRSLLMLVLIAALVASCQAGRRRYSRLSERYRMKSLAARASADNMEEFARLQDQGSFKAPGDGEGGSRPSSALLRRRAAHYRALADKYWEAAGNPWNRPAADPPLPE
jgi:hypothetical protein